MSKNCGSDFIRSAPLREGTKLRVCLGCHFTGYPDQRGRCPRCHIPLLLRRRHSLQKCWAALLASIVLLLPANLLPISIIYLNGGRQEDTILSELCRWQVATLQLRESCLSPVFWYRLLK